MIFRRALRTVGPAVTEPCSGSALAPQGSDSTNDEILGFILPHLLGPAAGPSHGVMELAPGVPESRITDREKVAVPALEMSGVCVKKNSRTENNFPPAASEKANEAEKFGAITICLLTTRPEA